jgi:hypothetical protein
VSVDDLRRLGVLSWHLRCDDLENDPQLAAIRKARGYSYQVLTGLGVTRREKLGTLQVWACVYATGMRLRCLGPGVLVAVAAVAAVAVDFSTPQHQVRDTSIEQK